MSAISILETLTSAWTLRSSEWLWKIAKAETSSSQKNSRCSSNRIESSGRACYRRTSDTPGWAYQLAKAICKLVVLQSNRSETSRQVLRKMLAHPLRAMWMTTFTKNLSKNSCDSRTPSFQRRSGTSQSPATQSTPLSWKRCKVWKSSEFILSFLPSTCQWEMWGQAPCCIFLAAFAVLRLSRILWIFM